MTLCFSARSTVSSCVCFVDSRSNRRLSCRIRDAGASVSVRGLGSKFTFLEGRARVAGAIGRRTARPRSKARREPNHMHFGHPPRRNLWPKAGDHLAAPKPIATPIGAQLGARRGLTRLRPNFPYRLLSLPNSQRQNIRGTDSFFLGVRSWRPI